MLASAFVAASHGEIALSSSVKNNNYDIIDDEKMAKIHELTKDSAHSGLEWAFRYLISESYKFIRMADDLHDVASHLSDIRICFMALTVTVYLLLAAFLIRICLRRSQRQVASGRASVAGGAITGNGGGNSNNQRRHYTHNNRTSHWDYQFQTGDDYLNVAANTTGQTDDLVSVRSDGQMGASGSVVQKPSYMMSRNRTTAAAAAPSLMRHSHAHYQPGANTNTDFSSNISPNATNLTTRLIGNENANNSRCSYGNLHHHHHQIPHIVTPSSECKNTNNNVNDDPETPTSPATTSAITINTPSKVNQQSTNATTSATTSAGEGSTQQLINLRHHLSSLVGTPSHVNEVEINTTGI